MKELKDMTRDELLEVIRIKDILMKEMREELEAYQKIIEELQNKR